MDNLWKKEIGRSEYVDIFASEDSTSQCHRYIEFIKTQVAQKDNRRSAELRAEGNKSFGKKNYTKAMKSYNQSLCFAEIGSEEEALAYSNRSACFFHMRLYKEALVDIELAKHANLPDRLAVKLDDRRVEALKLMSTVERKERFEPKLDYEADETYPCMANVVEIKYNEKFGRHLVAKSDIPVGQTIVVENDVHRFRDESSVCYTCSKLYTNCVACPNCCDVAFCNIDCMNRNQTHKWECGTYFSQLQLRTRYEIRKVLLAIASFPDVDSLMKFVEDALVEAPDTLPSLNDSKSKYHFFFKLSTSAPYPLGTTQAYKLYEFTVNLPKVNGLFNNERKKRFLMHLFMHTILISSSNEFGTEKEAALGYITSLLNHSCAPNVMNVFSSSYLFCVTGRPIEKGEQLYIAYGLVPDGVERKTYLKERWGFTCGCEQCEPRRASTVQKLIKSDSCYKYMLKNQKNMENTDTVQKQCIEFLNKFGRSPWLSGVENVFSVYYSHSVTKIFTS